MNRAECNNVIIVFEKYFFFYGLQIYIIFCWSEDSFGFQKEKNLGVCLKDFINICYYI